MAFLVKIKDGDKDIEADISKPIPMKRSGKQVCLSDVLPLSSFDQNLLRKSKADLFDLDKKDPIETQEIIDKVLIYIFKKADPSLEDEDILASVPSNKRFRLINIIASADDPSFPF